MLQFRVGLFVRPTWKFGIIPNVLEDHLRKGCIHEEDN